MFMNRGVDKKRCSTYIQWNVTQPSKKNKTMPSAATWMDPEVAILGEISQTEEDQYMISHIYGI